MPEKTQSHQELQELIDNLSTFVAKLDLNGMMVMVNNVAQMASGVPREELYKTNFITGQWWSYDKAVSKRVKESFDKALAGEVIHHRENIYVFGDVHIIDFVLTPVKDSEGKLKYILAEGRDITELEKAKEALEEITRKNQAILQNIGEGIVAVDLEGNILFMNPMATAMFEVNAEAVQSKPIFDVFDVRGENGSKLPKDEWPTMKALSSNKAHEGLIQIHKKSGETRMLKVLVKPIAIMGKPMGAVVIYIDVTKEREVDRMKTEFVSLASHQLRTPLTSIKWSSEMLMSGEAGDLGEQQKTFIQNIMDSTEGMIGLVNTLLNVSKIESGKIVVELEATDVKGLLDHVLKDVAPKLKEKKMEIHLEIAEPVSIVSLDPQLIRQVYQNLLTNAIKYTPEGGQISVKVSIEDGDLLSEITDTGYGIPSAEQGRVFQKFYRGSNVLKEGTGGNGLGLYLIKSIIETSGGRIWFTSEESKGTSFFFTLPLSVVKKEEEASQQPSE